MKLIIDASTLIVGNDSFLLSDIFDKDFYTASDAVAEKFTNDTWFVNELYLNFIQKSIALDIFLTKNKIKIIDATNSSSFLFYFVEDLAKKKNIKFIGKKRFSKIINIFTFHLELVSSSLFLFFLLLKIPYVKFFESNDYTKFSITRTPASKIKIKRLNIPMKYEDPKNKKSIYSLFKRTKRLSWVMKSWITSYKQIKALNVLMRKYIGVNSRFLLNSFYGRRIVHVGLYNNLLDFSFRTFNVKEFYTGNNLDRFAMIEESLSKKYGIKLICIPHGLEYGFKLPKCFIGDVFYTTSSNAENHLKDLYKREKFVFKKDVISLLLKSEKSFEKTSRIVYFTEPREGYVNHHIINEMLPLLGKNKLELKLHPKDNINDYLKYNLNIIKNLDEAINNNICVARKSTILLEALYNNSSVTAILLNEKDKSIFLNFPSLQDPEIHKTFSVDSLAVWIMDELKKRKTLNTNG